QHHVSSLKHQGPGHPAGPAEAGEASMTTTATITIEKQVHFSRSAKGRKGLQVGAAPPKLAEAGRVPRISRLMALALHYQQLLDTGEVSSYAELARMGHVT